MFGYSNIRCYCQWQQQQWWWWWWLWMYHKTYLLIYKLLAFEYCYLLKPMGVWEDGWMDGWIYIEFLYKKKKIDATTTTCYYCYFYFYCYHFFFDIPLPNVKQKERILFGAILEILFFDSDQIGFIHHSIIYRILIFLLLPPLISFPLSLSFGFRFNL